MPVNQLRIVSTHFYNGSKPGSFSIEYSYYSVNVKLDFSCKTCKRTHIGKFFQNKGWEPVCHSVITRQKLIFLKESFIAAWAVISSFSQTMLTFFPKAGMSFNYLIPVVVNFICFSTTAGVVVRLSFHFSINHYFFLAVFHFCYYYPLQSDKFSVKIIIEHIWISVSGFLSTPF